MLAALFAWHPAGGELRQDRPLPWDVALFAGAALLLGARWQFMRHEAEIMTFARPNRLVTGGLFRFSRNPMYLGFGMLLLAGALFVNTACALLAPLAFMLVADRWYIPFEERRMLEVHGEAYERYAARVRRWI